LDETKKVKGRRRGAFQKSVEKWNGNVGKKRSLHGESMEILHILSCLEPEKCMKRYRFPQIATIVMDLPTCFHNESYKIPSVNRIPVSSTFPHADMRVERHSRQKGTKAGRNK
jgi:hypothetical protein